MREITSHSAGEYLYSTGRVPSGEPIDVRELAGGVSNVVLLVSLPARREAFVLKQARGRLRVQEEWLCPVERIWREVETLRICGQLIQVRNADCGMRSGRQLKAIVPEVLWEDRENFCYAMTAAPAEHKTWKEKLLAGETDESLAVACGALLGSLHAGSWRSTDIASRLDDRTFFEQLRIDPYYRHLARVHPDVAPAVRGLIDSVWENRLCLVHGDFSPKNLLVWPGHVMLIDFEVGHFGDPAFDLGFFLTHLVLKGIWSGQRQVDYLALANRFWRAYQETVRQAITEEELISLEQRMLRNLAGCLLARVDGKSPVDYLTAGDRQRVRNLAKGWLAMAPAAWDEAIQQVLSTEY